MYKEIKSVLSNDVNIIQKLPDGVFIPFDPANIDYQAYLKWLSEGNEPLPAEEQ